jgi:putative copper export protein/methionine-rich copper-binding protein CopC
VSGIAMGQRPDRRGWLLRVVLLAIATTAIWLTMADVAQAHPVLLRSTPSGGQTVLSAPRQIDLWFSEPPVPGGVEISLSDSDGRAIPIRDIHLEDRGIHLVLTGFPALSRSVYEVRWSVVSKYDLHRLQGTLVFGVGVAATSSGDPARSTTGPAAAAADVGLGWMDVAGTAVLCGWVFLMVALARRREPALPEPVMTTMLSFVIAFGFLSAITSALHNARQWAEVSRADSGLTLLAGSGQLTRWTVRELVLAGILVLLVRQARGTRPGPAVTLLLGTLVLLDIVLRSASSHAQGGPVSLLVLSAHQAAALTWLGGLTILALVTSQLGERRTDALRLWKAFGPFAAACVAALSVTGLLLAGRQVATLDAGLTTGYGRALAIKLLLVIAVLLLGLRHARRLHPWLTRRTEGREPKAPTARSQAIGPLVGAAVLLFAVILTVTPPARGPQFTQTKPTVAQTTFQAGDLVITASLRPNQPGRSLLVIDVVSSRRPAPAPITAVSADVGSITGIALRRSQLASRGDGQWQAPIDIEATGELPLRIVAVRSHPGPATVTGTWVVPTGLPVRSTVISDSPLTPWTTGSAALIAVLLLVGGAGIARRKRRHRTETAPSSEQRPLEHAESQT